MDPSTKVIPVNPGSRPAPKQQISLMEGDGNTVIAGNFNTPLSTMDRLSRQKINKEDLDLNNITDQMDLTDMYGTFHQTRTEHTLFSSHTGHSQ